MTFLQLLMTHVLILGFASFTRGARSLFDVLGFSAAVAPSLPHARGKAPRPPAASRPRSTLRTIGYFLSSESGGIAGGGIFEFDLKTAKQVLPVAIVFVVKIVLSNLSYAYEIPFPDAFAP